MSELSCRSPLERFLTAGNITRIQLSARSGVHLNALATLAGCDHEAILRLPISTLCRVAAALGCAPAELFPLLASRPRVGLLWERGVIRCRSV